MKSSGYSKTCVKPPLKNRQNKNLMANDSLMEVKRRGAFCNTFGLHYMIIDLENQFSVFESGRITHVSLY